MLIAGVLQDGPASRAGLRPGDVVTQVGDRPVRTTGELFAAVAALRPASTVVIGVQRGEQHLEVKATVGERPRQTAPGR